jgi:aminoglycoside 3-N-acetyltransferase
MQKHSNKYLIELFNKTGLKAGMHIIMHSSFRAIKTAVGDLRIEELIRCLQLILTSKGSLIMPAFTYNYKKSSGEYELFDRRKSQSRVGSVAEVFRKTKGVIRTSSPTHSFSMWGAVTKEIAAENSPESPLGYGSVMEWLTNQENSYALLVGADFKSLSYIHYLEVVTPVPWVDVSPWTHLNVLKIGASLNGEQILKELPGCSEGFQNFEQFLLNDQIILPINYCGLRSYKIPISTLYQYGKQFLSEKPEALLCEPGKCPACDQRWEFYLKSINKSLYGTY